MVDTERMNRIAERETTISNKIRALDNAKFARADIARFLKRRYQHVRNVLEADKERAKDTVEGTASPPVRHLEGKVRDRRENNPSPTAGAPHEGAAFRLSVGDDGALILPESILEAMGGRGATIIGFVEDGRLTLVSAEVAMTRAQELVRASIPGSDSLADSLIASRRLDAAKEREHG